MYKIKIIILVIVFLVSNFFILPQTSQNTVQEEDYFSYSGVPYDTVANSDDLTALFFNPAGLYFHPLQAGYYYHHNIQKNLQDHTVLVNLFGLAFSTQWRFADNGDRIRTFTLGTAFGYREIISVGFTYSWTHSNLSAINDYQSFNLGIILRPWRYLSFGVVGKTLNAPSTEFERLKSRWEVGVSIRPYTERLTISIEALVYNHILWVPRYTLEYEPIDGFSMYTSFDHNFNLLFGLRLTTNLFQFSSFSVVNQLNNRNNLARGDSVGGGILIGRETYQTKIDSIFRLLEIPLDIVFEENKKQGLLLFKESISFLDILQAIKKAENDRQINGILITGREFAGGWGQAEELHNALLYFNQKTNKPIYSFLENSGHKEYYIASVANSISMPPAATLELAGFKSDIYFFKDLLDKIGIKADFIQKGEYKTAPDIFTRTKPTEKEKEQVVAILKDLSSQFKETILTHRKDKIKSYKAIEEKGIINVIQAKQLGLIDKIEYFLDLEKRLKKNNPFWKINISNYIQTKFYNDRWAPKDQIAVLVLEGDILSGRSQVNELLNRAYVSSDEIQKVIRALKRDYKIKGVIVRINSSGGSSLASDIIWKEIQELSRVKKVIVSFSNIAASGGYYIATAVDTILTNENTITGSIGVFGGKFSFKELYAKLGIQKHTLKTNPNATIFTESDTFTKLERALLDEHLTNFYDLFISRIERSRIDLTKEQIKANANGKVYSGTKAIENKMVNKKGGLLLAVQILIEQLKLDRKYLDIVTYPREDVSIVSNLFNPNLIIPSSIQKLVHLFAKTKNVSDNKIFFLMPYNLDIQ